MTPFSATHEQGGMTSEAAGAHQIAPAPELPAFTIPSFGLAARSAPTAPGLSLAPFALASHAAGSPHVEDGPVAFSIASTLMAPAMHVPVPVYEPAAPDAARDLDLSTFHELQVDHGAHAAAPGSAPAPAPAGMAVPAPISPAVGSPIAVALPGPDVNATFDALATLAPEPEPHLPAPSPPAHLAFPASGIAPAAQPSLGMLFALAVRARIEAFGRGPRHRSAHEWVFLMLAFAVMALLAAPPLVAVFQAMHGAKP